MGGIKMKKYNIFIGIGIALAVSLLLIVIFPKQYVVELSQAQLQQRVDARFPIEKKSIFLETELRNPKVFLMEESERIGLTVEVGIQVIGIADEFMGMGTISSGISYSPEKGEFYLLEPKFEELEIGVLPSQYVEKAIGILNFAAGEFLDNYPIYELNKSDLKQQAVRLVLKDITISDGVVKLFLDLPKGREAAK